MSKKNRRQGFVPNPDGETNNENLEGEEAMEEVVNAEAVEETTEEAVEAVKEVAEEAVAPVEEATNEPAPVEEVKEEVKEEAPVVIAPEKKEEKKEAPAPVVTTPVVEEVKEDNGELAVGDTVIIVPTVEKDLTGVRFGGNAYAAKYTVDRFQGKDKVIIKSKVSRFTMLKDQIRKV